MKYALYAWGYRGDFALVASSEDAQDLVIKMDIENQCWSDEGIFYFIISEPGIPVSLYENGPYLPYETLIEGYSK